MDGVILGTVCLVVSNPTERQVFWYSIEVQVPLGNGTGALTAVPSAVDVRVEQNNATESGETPTPSWDDTTGVLTVSTGGLAHFKKGGSLILVLEGFPVSSTPGAVLLKATEEVSKPTKGRVRNSPATVSLLKRAPRVPRNFRPEKSLLAAGEKVVLLWDGPDTLDYDIQYPDGTIESVPPRSGGSGWTWSPKADRKPKLAATYTLIATPRDAQHPPYHLTTSVQLSSPEFIHVTATAGVNTPWVQGTTTKGQIFFRTQGAEIRKANNARGTLSAQKAELDQLHVVKDAAVDGPLTVKGKVDAGGELHAAQNAVVDGTLSVGGKVDARSELRVAQGATVGGDLSVDGRVNAQGELHAAQGATVAGDLAVGGRVDAGGELHIAQSATVAGNLAVGGDFAVNGRNDTGGELHAAQNATVAGDLAVNGRINAGGELRAAQNAVVDGALSIGGKVDTQGELHVAQSASVGGDLTVDGRLDIGELLVARKATVGGDLAVNGRADVLGGLLSAGRTVIGDDLTVNGKLDAGGELHTAGKAFLGGDLDVGGESVFTGRVNANALLSVRNNGNWLMHVNDDLVAITTKLRIHGDSLFTGKVNANALLSVRNGEKWLMHINDDSTQIVGNLRVHGAFRSDS
ncbi:hypothetical protein DVK44_31815 [Streptomyces paludis]|uniref:Uncharacterized protein n=1 Tax=Streptomyces paludis TaxID=2282738 RepID=A0A345HXW7_9ACTN|nr:hypothetical protein DVK44_31815 [Streptomyces paludis]